MQIPGIIHRSELTRRGIDSRQVIAWQREGSLRSVPPWYVMDKAPEDVVALLRLGVRPTCIDAAVLHGLWTPPETGGVHVFRPRVGRGRRAATRSGSAPDALARAAPIRRRGGQAAPTQRVAMHSPLVHHAPALRAWPDTHPVPRLGLLLDHAGRCLHPDRAAPIFESVLRQRRLSGREVERIVAALPYAARRALANLRSDADSGTETVVRRWFQQRGVRVRPQVHIPSVGRVDLLVGGRWVIECDSREFHDTEDQYQRDRSRDLQLQMFGFIVTRLTWEQVFLDWPATSRKLQHILWSGAHHRPIPGL